MKGFIFLLLTTMSLSGLSQTVTVMSYNIRLDTKADGVNQWGNRIEKVSDLIKKHNPDLLGVQEALHNQMLDLQKHLPNYQFVGVARDDGKEKGEYSAIFYKKDKFDVLKQNTFWLSESPTVPGSKSWDAAITRVVTFSVLKEKSSGKSFIYANTHFDHMGEEARKNSANAIKQLLLDFMKGYKEIPALVSGDFNSEPTDEPYLNMINGKKIVLADARPATDLTGTFCGFEVDKIACRTIDYIFHSAQWKASHYKVIQDHDGKFYPSDHLPVMATFTQK
ncbi:MAG: endonuclease/exonuclease/phosphatase family protein [Cyclobacteriaceae bacterium]|nr:endonuclease/exonuclease/phosphatase family protein [Cyclobacteriaceae bacterium]